MPLTADRETGYLQHAYVHPNQKIDTTEDIATSAQGI